MRKGHLPVPVSPDPGMWKWRIAGRCIADLDLSLQAKVLQLLQDGRFSRLGDKEERHADIRVICATNRSLPSEIDAGRFRSDLFYRINVISISLPSLRERSEDIVSLADYFLKQLNRRFERDTPPFPEELMENLLHREWRGNIRELENLVTRYAILGSVEAAVPNLPTKSPSWPATRVTRDGIIPLKRIAKQAIREMEGNLILKALREHRWNRRKAAQALNISYRALIYKIGEAGLSPKSSRKAPQTPRPPDGGESMD